MSNNEQATYAKHSVDEIVRDFPTVAESESFVLAEGVEFFPSKFSVTVCIIFDKDNDGMVTQFAAYMGTIDTGKYRYPGVRANQTMATGQKLRENEARDILTRSYPKLVDYGYRF